MLTRLKNIFCTFLLLSVSLQENKIIPPSKATKEKVQTKAQENGGKKRKLKDVFMEASEENDSWSKKLKVGPKSKDNDFVSTDSLPLLDCMNDIEESEVPGKVAGTSSQAPPTQATLATPIDHPLATSTQAVGNRTPVAKRIQVSPIKTGTPFISCRKKSKKNITESEMNTTAVSFNETANQTAALFGGDTQIGTEGGDWNTPFTRLATAATQKSIFTVTTRKRTQVNSQTEADALWLEEVSDCTLECVCLLYINLHFHKTFIFYSSKSKTFFPFKISSSLFLSFCTYTQNNVSKVNINMLIVLSTLVVFC